MVLRERFYTAEEFFEIAALPENENRRLELVDGAIVEMPSSSKLNTITGIRIAHFISAFVIPRDLGYVTGADGGYKLSKQRVRRPDVGFISKAHDIDLRGVEFDIAPDLAVEVVSPDEDVFKKATEYLLSGTRIVWTVYAEERMVYVMTLNEQGAVVSLPFGEDDTLDGGDVLPEFQLAVKDIFPT